MRRGPPAVGCAIVVHGVVMAEAGVGMLSGLEMSRLAAAGVENVSSFLVEAVSPSISFLLCSPVIVRLLASRAVNSSQWDAMRTKWIVFTRF